MIQERELNIRSMFIYVFSSFIEFIDTRSIFFHQGVQVCHVHKENICHEIDVIHIIW